MTSKNPALPTLEEVRAAIADRSRRITLEDIAENCGVSVSWIKQVLSGEIASPAYDKVVAVYSFIAK